MVEPVASVNHMLEPFFEESDAIKILQKKNIMFVVVNVNINYRYPASLGQTLVIKSQLNSLAEVGGKKSTFQQTIYLENTDTIVCDALVTFVLFDANTQRAISMTEEIREMFVSEVSN